MLCPRLIQRSIALSSILMPTLINAADTYVLFRPSVTSGTDFECEMYAKTHIPVDHFPTQAELPTLNYTDVVSTRPVGGIYMGVLLCPPSKDSTNTSNLTVCFTPREESKLKYPMSATRSYNHIQTYVYKIGQTFSFLGHKKIEEGRLFYADEDQSVGMVCSENDEGVNLSDCAPYGFSFSLHLPGLKLLRKMLSDVEFNLALIGVVFLLVAEAMWMMFIHDGEWASGPDLDDSTTTTLRVLLLNGVECLTKKDIAVNVISYIPVALWSLSDVTRRHFSSTYVMPAVCGLGSTIMTARFFELVCKSWSDLRVDLKKWKLVVYPGLMCILSLPFIVAFACVSHSLSSENIIRNEMDDFVAAVYDDKAASGIQFKYYNTQVEVSSIYLLTIYTLITALSAYNEIRLNKMPHWSTFIGCSTIIPMKLLSHMILNWSDLTNGTRVGIIIMILAFQFLSHFSVLLHHYKRFERIPVNEVAADNGVQVNNGADNDANNGALNEVAANNGEEANHGVDNAEDDTSNPANIEVEENNEAPDVSEDRDSPDSPSSYETAFETLEDQTALEHDTAPEHVATHKRDEDAAVGGE